MSTAVIVVAFNSGDALTRCLDSLAGEDVIVVNNGARGPEIADAERRARVIGRASCRERVSFLV